MAIVVIYICFFRNPINSQTGSSSPTQPTITDKQIDENFKEGISGDQTLQNIKLSVISHQIENIENMDFNTDTQKCDKGTAITLLLYSDNISIPLSQIEKTEIRTKGGSPIKAEVKTFTLNNKKACLVFVKIEDNKELDSLSLAVKTYDGSFANFAMPTEATPTIAELFATDLGDATYGDLIYINGLPYFILENGVFESYTYTHDNTLYSEAVVGTILVPLTNLYSQTLVEKNFKTVYYSKDGEPNDYGTSISFRLNDEEKVEKYSNKFTGLYVELLTCTYRIKMDNKNDAEAVEHRDYMIDNTWYKIGTDDNALLKLKGKDVVH